MILYRSIIYQTGQKVFRQKLKNVALNISQFIYYSTFWRYYFSRDAEICILNWRFLFYLPLDTHLLDTVLLIVSNLSFSETAYFLKKKVLPWIIFTE